VEELKASERLDRDALSTRRDGLARDLDQAQAATEARCAYTPDRAWHQLDLASEG
jgi:hypothetical protein